MFIITFMTAGISGSTKKFAFGCSYQLGYAVGNIIGPQTYRAHDAPNYDVSTAVNCLSELFNLISIAREIHHAWFLRRYRYLNWYLWHASSSMESKK